MLDDLPHSYVDLHNPKHLIFSYSRVMAGVVDTQWKPETPLRILHIGAGAFTLPRYFAATRPGSDNTGMEIDPAVVDTAREDFGVRSSPRLHIEEGDARLLVGKEPAHSYDLIIGDAFSGHSVPWQLTTEEFLEEADRLLRPSGAYLMNMLDNRERFVRAEAATMKRVFPYVVLFSPLDSDNHVLVGSKVPVDPTAVLDRMQSLGYPTQLVERVSGGALARLIGGARFLEDDFAPVDQLLR